MHVFKNAQQQAGAANLNLSAYYAKRLPNFLPKTRRNIARFTIFYFFLQH